MAFKMVVSFGEAKLKLRYCKSMYVYVLTIWYLYSWCSSTVSQLHLLLVAISGINFGTWLHILVNHYATKLIQPRCETPYFENQSTLVEFLMIISHGTKAWWWNSYKCRSSTLICIKNHMPCNNQNYNIRNLWQSYHVGKHILRWTNPDEYCNIFAMD